MTQGAVAVRSVVFSGDVGVRDLSDAHAQLRKALSAGGDVEIDVDAVSDAGLGLIQLIESARVSAARGSARVCLKAPADGALKVALTRGGFIDESMTEARAFWLGA